MTKVDSSFKEGARRFLDRVQEELTATLPEASELRKLVRAEIASVKLGFGQF
jgi:hypothetical protein